MYFDEDHLLDIRLNTLFDYVDRFVIVEANIDHAGNKRAPKFKIEKFDPFFNINTKEDLQLAEKFLIGDFI